MKARGRATGVASGARAGDPHGNHLHPKWPSVPPGHLDHQVTNKRGPPELDRALRLDGRTGVVYWGDAKHEQASSLSHERVSSPTQPKTPITNLQDSGPSAPGSFSMMPRCGRRRGPRRRGGSATAAPRRRSPRSAQDRLSIDAEKQSKSTPPASTSQARVLTAINPPSRPIRSRQTLPRLSRCATGAEMRTGLRLQRRGD